MKRKTKAFIIMAVSIAIIAIAVVYVAYQIWTFTPADMQEILDNDDSI